MACLSKTLTTRLSPTREQGHRVAIPLAVAFCSLIPLGCAHLGKGNPADSLPHGTVCQVVTTWNHQIVHAPDPVHGGAPTPGLMGRLYLFGQEISSPLVEEGSVVVDLYDDRNPNSGETRPPLEEWRLDPETLKRLLKRDMIGWGYTLFLPWGTYKPDIGLVHLKICYQPAKGTPMYAESGALTLENATASGSRLAGRQPPGKTPTGN